MIHLFFLCILFLLPANTHFESDVRNKKAENVLINLKMFFTDMFCFSDVAK